MLDRKPEEEVKLLEIKSRKPATTTAAAPAAGAAAAVAAAAEIGGAEAAVGVLNLEDDDGTDDAPLPDPFEYVTDSED